MFQIRQKEVLEIFKAEINAIRAAQERKTIITHLQKNQVA